MGIQGMQASLRNNKRERKSLFDKNKSNVKSKLEKYPDQKKMTAYEFHEFQKKIKNENSIRQKKFLIKSGLSIVVLISVVIYLLFFARF